MPSTSSNTRLPSPRVYPVDPRMFNCPPFRVIPGTYCSAWFRKILVRWRIKRLEITAALTGTSLKWASWRVAVTTTGLV